MERAVVACAGILGAALVLAVAIHGWIRLQLARQLTLQKLLERGAVDDAALRAAGLATTPRARDLRVGALLVATGGAWSLVTYWLGGVAWILGVFPLAIGAAFLALAALHGRAR